MRIGWFVVALACGGVAFAQRERVERVGDRFAVRLHGVTDDDAARRIAGEALAVAEATWRPAVEIFGSPPRGEPLEIHLHRYAAGYADAEARITGGAFRHNLAFSSFRQRNAHVAIQPDARDGVVERVGLTPLTRRQIAHEAAHLVSFAAMPSYADHPAWFSEGAAMHVAERVARARRFAARASVDPETSTRIVVTRALREADRLPGVADVVHDRLGDLDGEQRYAVHWLVFRTLMRGPWRTRFAGVLDSARRLAPGRDFPARLAALFEAVFDAADRRAIDAAIGAWLDAQQPRWSVASPSIDTTDGGDWLQIANRDAPAIAWRTEENDAGFRIAGALSLDADSEASVLLGRTDAGCHAVVFSVDPPGLRVERRGRRAPRSLCRAPLAIEPGRRLRFTVRVAPESLEIVVDGDVIATIPTTVPAGRWGVAVGEGGVARWHRVAVRAGR